MTVIPKKYELFQTYEVFDIVVATVSKVSGDEACFYGNTGFSILCRFKFPASLRSNRGLACSSSGGLRSLPEEVVRGGLCAGRAATL